MNPEIRRAVRLLLAMAAAGAAGHAPLALAQDPAGAPAAVEGADLAADEPGAADEPASTAEVQESVEGDAIGEVVVTARQRSAVTDVIQERIEQPVVTDIVSAEQISRVGDSSVSLALRRLPGVTLVNNQFVYIRGLGERYSSTTLNGAYVPSPDLTRNVIPLDIFPADIVRSISIQKGFTPDRPAAFGGGNVDIRTRGVPEEFFAQFQVGSGWNTEHSRDVLTYSGGDRDRWGTDDGTRALPQEIRDGIQQFRGRFTPSVILEGLRRNGGQPTIEDAQRVNRDLALSLNRSTDIRTKSADPDVGLDASVGGKMDLGNSGMWRVGALALGTYDNTWRNRVRENRSVNLPELDNGRTERSINQVAITGSVTAGLEWGRDHEIGVLGLYLRNTDDETALTQRNNFNFRRADGVQLRDYRIRYQERDLELFQLSGRHALGDDTLDLIGEWLPLREQLRGTTFSWYYSDAQAATDIPNELTISAIDRINPATGAVLQTSVRSTSSAADFRYTELRDQVYSWGWKLEKPLAFGDFVANVSGGWDYYEKGRSYTQTQLGLGTTLQAAAPILAGTPGQVFTDANIRNPANGFQLTLGGIGTESYLAGEVIDAAFGAFDVTWRDTWRVSGGVRWEDYKQLSVPVDLLQFDPRVGKIPLSPEALQRAAKAEDDFYPAVALTWIRRDFWADEFQLRLGVSRTTARPDLREVAEATYIDPFTDARVRGNPNLVTSKLTNYDLRGEWFFANRDSLTLSFFYKDITNPIETVEGAGTDNNLSFTFINADTAELYGVELEWLKGMDFASRWVGDWASNFFVAGNLTWADSTIKIGSGAVGLTSSERRLTQQAEYVANVQLGFDAPNGQHSATLVFNTVGERLLFGGRAGAADAFEQPLNTLDLVYSWYPMDLLTVKLRAQNLLNEDVEVKQGGVVVLNQKLGTTFKLDFTLRF